MFCAIEWNLAPRLAAAAPGSPSRRDCCLAATPLSPSFNRGAVQCGLHAGWSDVDLVSASSGCVWRSGWYTIEIQDARGRPTLSRATLCASAANIAVESPCFGRGLGTVTWWPWGPLVFIVRLRCCSDGCGSYINDDTPATT